MKKINIFLDLDNTLINSITKDEETSILKPRMKKFNWKKLSAYKIFERPGLQDFLTFLFANFNVSIWTAASKSYALFIIDQFILHGHPERKIDYILYSYHCSKSQKIANSQKVLSILKDEFKLYNFDLNRTFIIDDHPEVYSIQPNNCIQIKAFEFENRKSYEDDELKMNIQPKLQSLLNQTSLNF